MFLRPVSSAYNCRRHSNEFKSALSSRSKSPFTQSIFSKSLKIESNGHVFMVLKELSSSSPVAFCKASGAFLEASWNDGRLAGDVERGDNIDDMPLKFGSSTEIL